MTLMDNIQAPISQGQSLGNITYYLNGNTLGSVSLVAETSVNKIGLLNMTKHVFNNWFTLLRI